MCIFCCFLVSTVTAADCCFSHNALFHYAWFLCIFANHILLTHTLACTGTHVGRRTHTPIGEESDGYERAGQANAFGPEWRLNWVIFRNGRDWLWWSVCLLLLPVCFARSLSLGSLYHSLDSLSAPLLPFRRTGVSVFKATVIF